MVSRETLERLAEANRRNDAARAALLRAEALDWAARKRADDVARREAERRDVREWMTRRGS